MVVLAVLGGVVGGAYSDLGEAVAVDGVELPCYER